MTIPPTNDPQTRRTDSPASDPVQVPPTVFAQLDALRQSGAINMYTEVQAGLDYFEFDAARQWLEANPDLYRAGLVHGFTPTTPGAVDPIDPDALVEAMPAEHPPATRTDATTPHEQAVLDHLQQLRRFDPAADAYYTDGTWRETASLTATEREVVELFDTAVDCRPRQCYRNALLTAATFGDTHDVVYVEGYVMGSTVASPLAHAWIELNGTVVELTFPDGPEPTADAAYLGLDFPHDAVTAKILDEGIAEPLVH